jgi:hypothetical protein
MGNTRGKKEYLGIDTTLGSKKKGNYEIRLRDWSVSSNIHYINAC